MNMENLRLPSSVRAYLSDPAVRTGVDALLAIPADSLPDGLEWHELGHYLSARAAAELTRGEWAVTLHQLWQSLWGAIEDEGWRPAQPDELLEHSYEATPEACWRKQMFATWHVKGKMTLYTAVRLTRSTTQVAFSLETTRPVLKSADEHFDWIDDERWGGWLVATERRSVADVDFDVATLNAFVTTALNHVRAATPR